jgi:hypothetical protein
MKLQIERPYFEAMVTSFPGLASPDLKQKLILPEEQTDLIDILTAEMDVLMDDIVAG